MQYWKFLHILSMFTAVTLLVGISVIGERVIASRDLAAMRRFAELYPPLERLGIVAIVLGIVFGFVTAIVGPWDLTQAWLITAYVIVAALMTLGPLEGKRFARVSEMARRAEGTEPTGELAALIADPVRRTMTAVSIALYVAIVFVMVVKPFS